MQSADSQDEPEESPREIEYIPKSLVNKVADSPKSMTIRPVSPPQPSPKVVNMSDLTPEEQTKLKLLKLLFEAREEQLQLSKRNKDYQRQLSEYFRTQKSEEMPLERTIADQDKFLHILQELDNTKEQLKVVQSEYDASINEMKARLGKSSNELILTI